MSNPQIPSVIPKEVSFLVHSEIDLDPDAFPQSRGAEAELHASTPSVSPSQKCSPLLRLSEAPPPQLQRRQVRRMMRRPRYVCATFHGCQIRGALVVDACAIPSVTMGSTLETCRLTPHQYHQTHTHTHTLLPPLCCSY